MPYERCRDVAENFWQELQQADPEEVVARTGAVYEQGRYFLPFFNRTLVIDPARARGQIKGAEDDPGFRVCLTALLYLLHLNPASLGSATSPLELTGGATFFRGHHGIPHTPLEERFGNDPEAFRTAGASLGGEPLAAGDAALAFSVFPGLIVEVILWLADEEFPAQVLFTVPSRLEEFWHLDAIWGLLQVVVEQMLKKV
ncbi:MAG: DUF3786 domain-containing protein [Desulfobacteraceae bacterium]